MSEPTEPHDPLTVLSTPDEPMSPRPAFASALKHRLEEASMTSNPATSEPSYLFYFTLPAPDLARSKAFYGAVFGWTADGGSMGGHVSNITPPGGLFPGGDPADRTVYLSTTNLDASLELVRANGGEIVGDIIDHGQGPSAECRDDQGTHFVLLQPEGEYATAPQNGSEHGDLFYFSMPIADGDKGRAFYGAVCGWTFGSQGSAGGTHAENMVTDGGIGAGRDGDRPEMWFRVDDIEAAITAIRDHGGTASEFVDTPQGLVSDCTDDQGVVFGIAQP